MLLFLMTLTIEEANSLVAKKIPLGPVVNGRKMLLKVENTQFPKQHVNFGEETFVSNKLLVTIHVVYNEHPSQALFSRLLGFGEGTTTISQMSSKISTETSRYAIQYLDSYQLQTLRNLTNNIQQLCLGYDNIWHMTYIPWSFMNHSPQNSPVPF